MFKKSLIILTILISMQSYAGNDIEKNIEIQQEINFSFEEKINELNSALEHAQSELNSFLTEDKIKNIQKEIDTLEKTLKNLNYKMNHSRNESLFDQITECNNNIKIKKEGLVFLIKEKKSLQRRKIIKEKKNLINDIENEIKKLKEDLSIFLKISH